MTKTTCGIRQLSALATVSYSLKWVVAGCFNYIIVRTSYISIKWWLYLSCSRPAHLGGFVVLIYRKIVSR
jgi:hypothetical protein